MAVARTRYPEAGQTRHTVVRRTLAFMIVVDSQSRRLTDDHDHELPGGRPHVSESLAGVLADAASGRFPPADGGVTIMPQPSPRDAGVIGFTAHAVIFVDADPAWVGWRCPARPRRRRPLGDRHRGRPGPARTRTGPSAGYGRQAPGPSRRAALGARAPGNAASVRACLAAGFAPVGA